MTAPTATEKPKADSRIPSLLVKNPLIADICRQYLAIVDEIAAYNEEVLAEKTADWTIPKVMEKAKELGNPTDANVPANEDIKAALEMWQALVEQAQHARRNVLEVTSKVLGITLSATTERNAETEKPLKEARSKATEIGKQLSLFAGAITDESASNTVSDFLAKNPLPAVGRDQVTKFGENQTATPKYRVTVEVSNVDGVVLVSESGFTKAALALTKHYPRGEAPKSDALREMWEKAGNTADNTVQSPVVFNDENSGLTFTITKK